MKKHLLYFFLLVILASSAKSQFAFIPDTNFRNFLMNNGFAGCMQGDSLDTTCTAVVNATKINCSNKNIFSLSGIEYFNNLDSIICQSNNLLSIPILSDSVSFLDCSFCWRLSSILTLPSSLDQLHCRFDSLTTLPALPPALTHLDCGNNHLSSMPLLPTNLLVLTCNSNQISALPILPSSLSFLDFSNNLLSSLPLLPPSLTFLGCASNQLTYIPALPSTLSQLWCENNQIVNFAFIEFPTSLITLHCENNFLTQWPSVDSCISLNYINCSHNQFTETPWPLHMLNSFTYLDCSYNLISDQSFYIPISLINLNCSHNLFTSLAFPNNSQIITLDCSYNQLTYFAFNNGTLNDLDCSHNLLDSLSGGYGTINKLNCSYNQLSNLPSSYYGGNTLLDCSYNQISSLGIIYWPRTFKCQSNQIAALPNFPDSLYIAKIDSNPITCLPEIHKIANFFWSNTSVYCLPNYGHIYNATPSINTLPLCQLSDSCPSLWNITGIVFIDADSSCTQDSGEVGLRDITVMLDSAGMQLQEFLTDNFGNYSFRTGQGNYTIRIDTASAPFRVVCPATFFETALLNVVDSMDTVPSFGLLCNYGFDLTAKSISPMQMFRPGFQNAIYLDAGEGMSFSGVNCSSAINGSVQAILSSLASFVSPVPGALSPTSINGDTITWNISDFSLVDPVHDFNIIVEVSTLATINDSVCVELNVLPTAGDNMPSNNSLSECFPIRSSFDPNEKYMSPSGLVDTSQQWFTFTIFFQNTGNAPAEDIYLIDTLDQNLDATTFTYLSSSHDVITQLLPGNILRFNYPDIYLMDSTANEPGSHGYVQFKIKRKENLAINTTISNTAYIYFDFNSAVATNRVEATFVSVVGISDSEAGDYYLYPNPAENQLKVFSKLRTIRSVEIVNVLNQPVLIRNFTDAAKSVLINVDGLHHGIYFLLLKTDSGTIVKRFIKHGD